MAALNVTVPQMIFDIGRGPKKNPQNLFMFYHLALIKRKDTVEKRSTIP